jgi:hypothetical protein
MIIYLYKKTHNITGLKYLGKTTKDPYKYQGSGEVWKPHIKEHGYDVTTEILKECQSKEELSYWGRYYSDLWGVVNSPEWANKIPETGGSDSGPNHPCYGKKRPDTSDRNSKRLGKHHPMYGTKNSELSKRNSENVGEKNPMYGKVSAMHGKKNPHLSLMNSKKTGDNNPMRKPEYQMLCEHCEKVISKGNYVRWHGLNCKSKTTKDNH